MANPINGNEIIFQTTPGHIWSGLDFWVSSAGFIGSETTLGGFASYKVKVPLFLRARKTMQYANSLEKQTFFSLLSIEGSLR